MGSQRTNGRRITLRRDGVDIQLVAQKSMCANVHEWLKGRDPDLPSWEDLGEEPDEYYDARHSDLSGESNDDPRPIGSRIERYAIGLAVFTAVLVRVNAGTTDLGGLESFSESSIISAVPRAMMGPMSPLPTDIKPADAPPALYPSLSWMSRDEAERFMESPDADDIRCLAQVLASETNDPFAMVKIAWVVRNRVEAHSPIFGEGYCAVAYKPAQFSGLSRGRGNRRYTLNSSRDYDMVHGSVVEQENWEDAIRRAIAVHGADRSLATLPPDVFFFYSPVSMTGKGYASWAQGCKAYDLVRDIDEQTGGEFHFAFYRGSTCKTLRVYLEKVGIL